MEKKYRLFVNNLPLSIDKKTIQNLFQKYGTVCIIDIKENKSVIENKKKFAFVTVSTTEQHLQTCFKEVNNTNIDGLQISVDLAKESFLDRLKKERDDEKLKKSDSHTQNNQVLTQSNSIQNGNNIKKSQDNILLNNNLYSINYESKEDNDHSARKKSNNIQVENNYNKTPNYIDNFKPTKIIKEEESEWNRSKNGFNNSTVINANQSISKICKNPEISESEKKRLSSLKQQKKDFKIRKHTIQIGLQSIDKKCNKKIIFDDNIDLQNFDEKIDKDVNKKNILFNSDDEDQEQFQWNENELDKKANLKKKLLKLQSNIGNDKRFALDERFIDDEDLNNTKNDSSVEKIDDTVNENYLDEKKWQLNILGNVLGKTISTVENHDTLKKKNKMIRYDPTANNHQDYEIPIEQIKKTKSDKKKKKKDTKIETNDVIPRSNELFYDVSKNLGESLKPTEPFSLLKMLGRSTPNTTDNKVEVNEVKEEAKDFEVNYKTKRFKYDSSDSEDNEEISEKTKTASPEPKNSSELDHKDDRFFFYDNDPRFQEAKNFFKNHSALEENLFIFRRRELKEIVRTKIRKNMKKYTPWGKKKIGKIQKRNKKKIKA